MKQDEIMPVAWMDVDGKTFPFVWNVSSLGVQQGSKYLDETLTPLYTHPPRRKPMTEEFIMDSTRELSMDVRWPSSFIDVWRLCEATHGIKE